MVYNTLLVEGPTKLFRARTNTVYNVDLLTNKYWSTPALLLAIWDPYRTSLTKLRRPPIPGPVVS